MSENYDKELKRFSDYTWNIWKVGNKKDHNYITRNLIAFCERFEIDKKKLSNRLQIYDLNFQNQGWRFLIVDKYHPIKSVLPKNFFVDVNYIIEASNTFNNLEKKWSPKDVPTEWDRLFEW